MKGFLDWLILNHECELKLLDAEIRYRPNNIKLSLYGDILLDGFDKCFSNKQFCDLYKEYRIIKIKEILK